MEMLVVARILSRPEPPKPTGLNGGGGVMSMMNGDAGMNMNVHAQAQASYYVSKSWCRAALKWLDVQAEERKQREQKRLEEVEVEVEAAATGKKAHQSKHHQQHSKQKKKKKSKKEERKNSKLSAKLYTTPPPSLDVNQDITCEHGCLRCEEGRGSRAKRRLLDKQAWKILKKLYPQGAQLSSRDGECLLCTVEVETEKRSVEMQKQKETEDRKMPLQCPLARGIYSRKSGVPKDCLALQPQDQVLGNSLSSPVAARKLPMLRNGNVCPLVPGVYNIIPRSWCYHWRKYIRTGEGGKTSAPDTSACLCDAHRLPLIPPHLQSFLSGETATLMDTAVLDDGTILQSGGCEENRPQTPRSLPVGFSPSNRQLGGVAQGSGIHSPRERVIGGERIPIPQPRVANRLMDDEMSQLRASGLSEYEIQLQRLAMLQIDEQRAQHEEAQERRRQALNNRAVAVADVAGEDTPMSPGEVRAKVNAQLDRENKVVVEIITDEEMEALEKWWPGIHSSYALKFAVVELDAGTMDVVWTTQPCNYCDASGKASDYDFSVRNRNRNWVNNTPKKRFGK